MSLTKITSDGITDGSIVNADLHSAANIAKSKLASLDIVNADVNASAAIAGTKISPDFGSQNIVTTGGLTVSGQTVINHNNLIVSGTSPNLFLTDTTTIVITNLLIMKVSLLFLMLQILQPD